MWRNPPANGSNIHFLFAIPVADKAPNVTPWKLRYLEIIIFLCGFPVCLKYWRTNLIAVSVASDPPLNSFIVVNPGGVILPRRSTSSIAFVFVDKIYHHPIVNGSPKCLIKHKNLSSCFSALFLVAFESMDFL